MWLMPGTYRVRLAGDLFVPKSFKVTIIRGRTAAIEESLERKTGYLTLYAEPNPPGLEIILNGKPFPNVRLPDTIRDLPTGEYVVTCAGNDGGNKFEGSEKVVVKWNKESTVTVPLALKVTFQCRSEPITVSEDDFKEVFGLDDKWRPVSYSSNDYHDNGDGTITDNATGLMWQQSGSDEYIQLKDVPSYINNLNRKQFAGYSDWRLPTIPELMSLLEPRKKNGDLYIDPLFGKKQWWCWSSDHRSPGSAWSLASTTVTSTGTIRTMTAMCEPCESDNDGSFGHLNYLIVFFKGDRKSNKY